MWFIYTVLYIYTFFYYIYFCWGAGAAYKAFVGVNSLHSPCEGNSGLQAWHGLSGIHLRKQLRHRFEPIKKSLLASWWLPGEQWKPRRKVSAFREPLRTVDFDELGLRFHFGSWGCLLHAEFYALNGVSILESDVLHKVLGPPGVWVAIAVTSTCVTSCGAIHSPRLWAEMQTISMEVQSPFAYNRYANKELFRDLALRILTRKFLQIPVLTQLFLNWGLSRPHGLIDVEVQVYV